MTRRCTRFDSASLLAFVVDAEHDRFRRGRAAPVWLEDRFLPAALLLLRPFREALTAIVLGGAIERSGR
jgi:hypothetical protein